MVRLRGPAEIGQILSAGPAEIRRNLSQLVAPIRRDDEPGGGLPEVGLHADLPPVEQRFRSAEMLLDTAADAERAVSLESAEYR